jgi:glutathione S-transferase
MALTLYGSAQSRSKRVLWTLAELGLDYVHVPYAFDDPVLKSPAFLAINPAGAIPAIDDDGVRVAESMAINLYLAKRYGAGGEAPLYPATPQGEADAWRWSLWAQAHLEPWVQKDALMADLLGAMGEHRRAVIAKGLELLDGQLAGRTWLLGEDFTVADLNVAAVLSPSRAAGLDLTAAPNVRAWLDRCYTRPAALAMRARFG